MAADVSHRRYLNPLCKWAIMSTLTVHCWREDETARERTLHPPAYAEAKKLKPLTLHTHGCLSGGNLRGLVYFFSLYIKSGVFLRQLLSSSKWNCNTPINQLALILSSVCFRNDLIIPSFRTVTCARRDFWLQCHGSGTLFRRLACCSRHMVFSITVIDAFFSCLMATCWALLRDSKWRFINVCYITLHLQSSS